MKRGVNKQVCIFPKTTGGYWGNGGAAPEKFCNFHPHLSLENSIFST